MVEKKKDANKAKVAREISKIWGGLEERPDCDVERTC